MKPANDERGVIYRKILKEEKAKIIPDDTGRINIHQVRAAKARANERFFAMGY